MTAEVSEFVQEWDGERDEIDIDTNFDDALEAGEDEGLTVLLDDLTRLMRFQSRVKDVAELQTFVGGVAAFAAGEHREALFLLTQELQANGIGPGLLLDKLLLWLGRRLEAAGDQEAALWAYTECEEDGSEDEEERLREVLGYDDYSTERSWNEAIFAHYKGIVEAQPTRASAWEILALQHSLLEQPDEAIEAAKQAVALDPSRQQSHQVLIELWGERGDAVSLDELETHLQETLKRCREGEAQGEDTSLRQAHEAWLRFAMAEFLFVHRKDFVQAREYCAAALALAPGLEDANELMCHILRELEDWDAMVDQLEEMIKRGEDRVELFELYDDLADVYEQGLEDARLADVARERAGIYADAWSAEAHVRQVFRDDPTDRHLWRVLRGLLHETGRWTVLFETALERLEHETDNSHIHEIYEGLFVVLQGLMENPPWRVLQAHLEERIDDEPPAALRLLLQHHLGWVSDQIRAEEAAGEMLSGKSRVDPANLEQSEDDARSFARTWAFFAGHPMHEKRLVLHFGVFLLALPVIWLLLDGVLAGAVLAVCLVLGSVLLSLGAGGYVADWLAPTGGDCVLCKEQRWEYRPLSMKSPVYSWARTERGRVPYWGRCKACGFDSRAVYQPATSGLVKMTTALHEAQGDFAVVVTSLRRATRGNLDDLPEVLTYGVGVWNQLHFCQEARPEIFEAYQTLLLEAMPVLKPLRTTADKLWTHWSDGERTTQSGEELLDLSEALSEHPEDIKASYKAAEHFDRLLSLHISHLHEKILANKAV